MAQVLGEPTEDLSEFLGRDLHDRVGPESLAADGINCAVRVRDLRGDAAASPSVSLFGFCILVDVASFIVIA